MSNKALLEFLDVASQAETLFNIRREVLGETEPQVVDDDSESMEEEEEVQENEDEEDNDNEIISDLEQKVLDLKDQLMRTLADGENLRKRTLKDVEHSKKYSHISFVKDLVSSV